MKTLIGISQGIPIVTEKFITDSITKLKLQDPFDYIISDKE